MATYYFEDPALVLPVLLRFVLQSGMNALYVVATPIGNLGDITLRAIETLNSVELIVCEDTRHSRHLLTHLGISKQLMSGHGHNESSTAPRVIEALRDGRDVAYISDAGTPGVSDPGRVIVREVRSAGFPVVPIPGPSALSALLSVNAFPGKTITFEGFLSPKSGRRRKRLSELLERDESFLLYESPHRVLKLLQELSDLDSRRQVLFGRELTKLHEEILEGTAEEILDIISNRASVKGEIALLVGPSKKG
jgi:16S rRNA (cytidine1402-2'-O)-methyltransferase